MVIEHLVFKQKEFRKGFSLIELLIAIAVSSMILVVVVGIINIVLSRSKGGFESFQAQSEAVGAMNSMAKEIRQVSELVAASSQSITFLEYLDVDDDAPYQVKFWLDGETLKREEIPPSGVGPTYTYNPADRAEKIVSFEVINGASAIFTYFDQDENELAAPITLGAVTLVDINLTFRQLSNANPLEVTTRAQLRFNKTNL